MPTCSTEKYCTTCVYGFDHNVVCFPNRIKNKNRKVEPIVNNSNVKGNVLVCMDVCKSCEINFVKNPSCSGDYYSTISGFVLMRYCPTCGVMRPLVEDRNPNYVSNNMKKRIAVRVATTYNRGYEELKKIVKSLYDIPNKDDFIKVFAKRVGLSITAVADCCI